MTVTDTGPGAPEGDETGVVDTGSAVTAGDAPGAQPANADVSAGGDTFPRSYVEELRKESGGYRDRAKAAEANSEAVAKRLHRELVKASNRLENADDLPYDAEHLDDADKMAEAIEALLTDRPYLARRVVKGDAGQGNRGGADSGLNLLAMLTG